MHPKRGRELGEKWWWLFWLLVILAVVKWLAEAFLERMGL